MPHGHDRPPRALRFVVGVGLKRGDRTIGGFGQAGPSHGPEDDRIADEPVVDRKDDGECIQGQSYSTDRNTYQEVDALLCR